MACAGELPTKAVASGSHSSGCERDARTREATAPLNFQSKAGRPLRRGCGGGRGGGGGRGNACDNCKADRGWAR
eukprot:684690-Pyramimonas_sp.AAC.1